MRALPGDGTGPFLIRKDSHIWMPNPMNGGTGVNKAGNVYKGQAREPRSGCRCWRSLKSACGNTKTSPPVWGQVWQEGFKHLLFHPSKLIHDSASNVSSLWKKLDNLERKSPSSTCLLSTPSQDQGWGLPDLDTSPW